MKRCLITAGGLFDLESARSYVKDKHFDMVIAADAGLELLKALAIKPNAVVGDFDTVKKSVVEEFSRMPGVEWEVHKPEKDETDMELALMIAGRKGAGKVDILGGTGGRIDHTIGNIHLMLPFFKQGMEIRMVDSQNMIRLLGPEKPHVFQKEQMYGKYISFLPLTETVEGINLTGFKYPLVNKTITIGTSLCISNEIVGQEAVLTFSSGILICVESHD